MEIGWNLPVDAFRIEAPNGGETLERGGSCAVTWVRTGSPGVLVYIDCSTDGGATYDHNVASGVVDNLSFTWTVDAAASSSCRLMLRNSDFTVSDVSDQVFTILEEGTGALPLIGEGCEGGAAGRIGLGSLLVLAAAVIALRVLARTAGRAL